MKWQDRYPELRLLGTERAIREAADSIERSLRVRVALIAMPLQIVWGLSLWHIAVRYFGTYCSKLWCTVGSISVVMPLLLTAWVVHRRAHRHVRNYLVIHGIPVCLHCGYSLRGLTEPRCPECGREFEPYLLALGNREGNQQDAKRAKAAEQSDS